MAILRSSAFNIFFFGWLFFVLFIIWILLPLPSRFMRRAVRCWASVALWGLKTIAGLGCVIEGSENIPQGAAVVASKHQSAWDTIIFLIVLRKPQYALKRELMRIPLWGWYAKKCGMLTIDRKAGAKALKTLVTECQDRLYKGGQVIIFPEGTRVAPNERKPYLRGVAALYSSLPEKVPLVPVALNSGKYWGRRSYTKKSGVITVSFLMPISPGLSKKQFMEELECRIEAESDRLLIK